MTLTQELEQVGITKTQLAELLNVNRKTIQRLGEDITPEIRTILDSLKEPPYKWLPVSPDLFDGYGRGVPIEVEGQRVVLVSKGFRKDKDGAWVEQGVVSEKDWKARLDYTCKHGREGWSCKLCLK